MEKKFGSGMHIADHISESIETVLWFKNTQDRGWNNFSDLG
jgi:hypothetical protein